MNPMTLSQGGMSDKRVGEFCRSRILVSRSRKNRVKVNPSMFRFVLRLLLASLFLFAGSVHLINPTLFLPLMPPWIPFHLFCIEASGIFELLGGIGLLIPMREAQIVTGLGLVLLLVAIFPANIYMAAAHVQVHGFPPREWMAWARLPVQPLLMVAVLWVTRLWPRQKEAS